MMKKVIIILLSLFTLGCESNSTQTKAVVEDSGPDAHPTKPQEPVVDAGVKPDAHPTRPQEPDSK